MYSICDKFLTRAARAAQQDRGIVGGHLADELANLLHGARVADEVGGVEALAELVLQAQVFVEKLGLLGAGALAGGDRLADHGGYNGQQAHGILQAFVVFIRNIDANGAYYLLLLEDGHANERGLALGRAAASAGAVEKERLAADARHDHGFARFYDLAGDAFPDIVAAPLDFRLREAIRHVNGDLGGFLAQEADRPQTHVELVAHELENDVECLLKLGRRA